MAFWSSEKLRQRVPQDGLVVPFDAARIKHGAYELAVGPEAFITSVVTKTTQSLDPGERVIIPPGQFGLLLTEEVVKAPNDAMGFISIRASIKFHGLVNVSGFHVDPGFAGRLKFAVYNAGSREIIVSRGQSIFMLWFSDLDCATADGYGGLRPGQNEITSQDLMRMQGEIASPAQLKKDIEELHHSLNNLKWVATVVIALLIAAVGQLYFRQNPAPVVVQMPAVQQQPRVGAPERGLQEQASPKPPPASVPSTVGPPAPASPRGEQPKNRQ